jgi:hypothetical protein
MWHDRHSRRSLKWYALVFLTPVRTHNKSRETFNLKRLAVVAAAVANAAHNHMMTAMRAIHARFPTLVEKPLALTEADASEIVALAERNWATSRVPLLPKSAVAECRLTHQVLPIYLQRQAEWLAARIGQPIDHGI